MSGSRFARALRVASLLAPLALIGATAHAEAPPAHPAPVRAQVTPPRAPVPHAAPRPVSGVAPKLPKRVEPHAAHEAQHAPDVHGPLDVPLPRGVARQKLLAVRTEIARRVSLGEQPYVVFDIDDTLLTWPRGDTPRLMIPGALAYLLSLKKAGAKIVYVTGRGLDMRAETEEQLRTFGFPLSEDEKLFLNDTELRTVEFKTKTTKDLVRAQGKPVAAFDNEKENARMFRRELGSDVTVVRLRTTSQRPDPGGDGAITVVDDFTPALGSLHALEPASSVSSAAP